MTMRMTLDEWLRAIAGTFVLLSLALGWFVHPAFFLFTAFVGANLLAVGVHEDLSDDGGSCAASASGEHPTPAAK